MHEKKIANLLALSANERVEYFVRHCADFEEVWGLAVDDTSWVIIKDSDGDEAFLVWPHQELAEACCFPEHKELGAKPRKIPLESFINKCVPDMNEENIFFGVFYDKERSGLAIPASELGELLKAEAESVWE
ncbi:DUF2750 domain-containing protein [Pleionea sp. CnH1-48]|uniref:DUF2750 domain-containing protein n=1 Tax=Pleionea sp. CnH1-48 TaxID=2954494 RepID=UPI002097545E|nr:DUF2750 domain-containing protein [Pleionea sp. CnH1-48]MCO7227523.1 DUF2750 domain-containing protein [Pleionea sp. CnH1-48]